MKFTEIINKLYYFIGFIMTWAFIIVTLIGGRIHYESKDGLFGLMFKYVSELYK